MLGPLSVARDGAAARAARGEPADAAATLGPLTLQVPGRHNLQNALAAVAVGLELGLSFDRIAAGARRNSAAPSGASSVRGEPNGILVVDDYGHHPTEIAAVLAAARALDRRIVVAFQPHRYHADGGADGRVRPGARAAPTTSC